MVERRKEKFPLKKGKRKILKSSKVFMMFPHVLVTYLVYSVSFMISLDLWPFKRGPGNKFCFSFDVGTRDGLEVTNSCLDLFFFSISVATFGNNRHVA